MHVDANLVENLLGPRKFTHEILAARDRIGVATGLVWTEFGGEIIFVEATRMKGHQQLMLTGSMGECSRNRRANRVSYARSHAEALRIDPDFFSQSDIHIHIPSRRRAQRRPLGRDHPGQRPSLPLDRPTSPPGSRHDRRNYPERRSLPVSGVREKLLAANGPGVKTELLPQQNQVDVNEVEAEAEEGLEIVLA